MLSRCLFCGNDFPPNTTVAALPHARRLAFDPARGRLWAVCRSCGRWTLAPIEERWEALEELERIARDDGRLLAETENISLLSAGELELVRVGRSGLPEEAWWRFGRELLRRRDASLRVAGRGRWIDFGVSLLVLGIPWLPRADPESHWVHRQRDRRFESHLIRSPAQCPRCGRTLRRLGFRDRSQLVLGLDAAERLELWRTCGGCGWYEESGGIRLESDVSVHVLRRLMAYHNYSGASEAEVRSALDVVTEAGSPTEVVRRLARRRVRPGQLEPVRAVALELALAEDSERRMLEMEVREIEALWRREEEIAAIVDDELTPLSARRPQ